MDLAERVTDSKAFTINLPTVPPPPPPPPPQEYCCEICGECFSTQAELNEHIASEHPPLPWKIPVAALIIGLSLNILGARNNPLS